MGYTPGMKTAVSIPDDVFEQAELLAQRLSTSRSALYARALVEYIARHSPDRITERMNEAITDAGGADSDFVAAAARETLRDTEW